MLVKYVRDALSDVPVAVIVATSPENIGVAICKPGEHFNKRLGRKIALGRALVGTSMSLPNRDMWYYSQENPEFVDCYSLCDVLDMEVNKMRERAVKYYKPTGLGRDLMSY